MLSIGILDPNPGLKGRARARFSRRPPAPGEKRGVDALRLTQRSPRRVLSWRSQRARRDTAGSPSGAASGVSGYEARRCEHPGKSGEHESAQTAALGVESQRGRRRRRGRESSPCHLPGERVEALYNGGGSNVYYAWLRTVSATGVAPLARGTAPLTSPTLASPHRQDASSGVYAPI